MGRKKDILILFAFALVAALLVSGIKIQSVEDYYLTHIDDINSGTKTVTLSIDCTALLEIENIDEAYKPYIPEDGFILHPTEFALRDGDSAFDILNRVVKKYRIQMRHQEPALNMFGSVYIKGIGHIYEYAFGETAGWIYLVNGESPDVGISQYKPSDGDVIELIYTRTLAYKNQKDESR